MDEKKKNKCRQQTCRICLSFNHVSILSGVHYTIYICHYYFVFFAGQYPRDRIFFHTDILVLRSIQLYLETGRSVMEIVF